jgi:hypothetical protein
VTDRTASEESSEEVDWYRSWPLDQYAIELRFVEDPRGEHVREVWHARLLEGPYSGAIPFDEIGQLVAALRVEGGPPVPHVVTHRQTYFSWGADAAAAKVIFEIASEALPGVAGAAVYEGLKHLVFRLVSQARSRSDEVPEQLSRGEAMEQARWYLAEVFELDYEAAERLELVGEKIVAESSRVFHFTLDDRRFEVELVDECGLIRAARLGWTYNL